MTHGVVSLLDPIHTEKVEVIWKQLEDRCGFSGVKITPYPHFSWQIADEYDFSALEMTLKDLSGNFQPFKVHTTGIGFFTGDHPVVYLPVIRTAQLMDLHEQIWNRIHPYSREPSQLYAPEHWVPHITLVFGDLTQSTIGCLLEVLARMHLDWEILIDHLALIFQPIGSTGKLRDRYEFGTNLRGNQSSHAIC
jgi:hypothetical protein